MYFSPGVPRLTFNRTFSLYFFTHLWYYSKAKNKKRNHIRVFVLFFLISTFLHCLSWVYFYLKDNLIVGGKQLLSPSGPLLFGSLFFPSVYLVITQLSFVLFVLCTQREGEKKKKRESWGKRVCCLTDSYWHDIKLIKQMWLAEIEHFKGGKRTEAKSSSFTSVASPSSFFVTFLFGVCAVFLFLSFFFRTCVWELCVCVRARLCIWVPHLHRV